MAKFVKVAAKNEIASGESTSIELGGKQIGLFNVDGTFYAMDNTCNHVGAPLSDGNLRGTIITCPWHGAQFDVSCGKAVSGPTAGDLGCYKVKVEGDDVQVEIPD